MKKIISAGLLVSLLLMTPACRTKTRQTQAQKEQIQLTFYGLFDNEDVYRPMIQAYQSQSPNVSITYKKFIDPAQYLDLIVNELAEGEGPDIFMMHNTWFPEHYRKLTPAPRNIAEPELFKSLFVDVASEDLIIPDDEGQEKVWGIPLYVDTLGLYYNDSHFEDAIPSQGQPSNTWQGILNDVALLTRQDNSFSRFERSAIALGRHDNILRAFDAMMLLLLQHKVDFYSSDLKQVSFAANPETREAFDFYKSFAQSNQVNFTWNEFLAEANSAEKELKTFASGKLSMLLGYSYTYEDILREIATLKASNEPTITATEIKVQEIPQLFDPEVSADVRVSYPSYFAPVVSRTSDHSFEAWQFISSMVNQENLRAYNQKTKRPAALRSLINEQKAHPIYGVFAAQVGYAKSIPFLSVDQVQNIILSLIENYPSQPSEAQNAILSAQNEIQKLIPISGVKAILQDAQ
jgi:ABC-type glycerol-3-phosphate transport system substrate-binding protein